MLLKFPLVVASCYVSSLFIVHILILLLLVDFSDIWFLTFYISLEFFLARVRMGDHLVLVVDRLSSDSGLGTVNRADPKADSVNEDGVSESISAGADLCESKFVQCRICHDEDEDTNMDTPCSCSGTLKVLSLGCCCFPQTVSFLIFDSYCHQLFCSLHIIIASRDGAMRKVIRYAKFVVSNINLVTQLHDNCFTTQAFL